MTAKDRRTETHIRNMMTYDDLRFKGSLLHIFHSKPLHAETKLEKLREIMVSGFIWFPDGSRTSGTGR